VNDLGGGRTQPMIALVSSHLYSVQCSGPSAQRRVVSGLPEHCKWGRAGIER
jgi:hypothetical protein